MTDIPLLTSPRPLLAILNRGEIVARIARSAKKVGFKILTIYSPEDHDSPHVNFGDCTVNLQRFFEQNRHVIQSNSQQDNKESAKQLSDIELYLSEGLLIELCIFYGVNYVHPGYGFLSESATFAAGLTDVGIKWVGPTSNTMETIGLKNRARAFAQSLDIPCVQGFSLPKATDEQLLEAAQHIKTPLLIKAASGGGGRGMRQVDELVDLAHNLQSARRESQLAFGNDDLLIEQYIPKAKHLATPH